MPAPVVAQALTALRTRLASIVAGPLYTHTVVTCELQGRTWHLVDDGERPYIGVQALRSPVQYQPGRQIREPVQVVLVCHLPMNDDAATRIAAQLELLDDIYQALDQNPTNLGVGGLTSVGVQEWLVDGSDPLAVHTIKVVLEMRTRRSPAGS